MVAVATPVEVAVTLVAAVDIPAVVVTEAIAKRSSKQRLHELHEVNDRGAKGVLKSAPFLSGELFSYGLAYAGLSGSGRS